MHQTTKANLFLLFATVIWGITLVIRNVVAQIDPNLFVTARFALATLILLPWVINKLKNTPRNMVFNCFIIGTLNAIAYISQTIGLKTISSSRSAFITGISVILVPFLAPLFKVGSLRASDIVCSIICLVGLYILTGASVTAINVGDEWTFLCAITFALQIIYIQRMSNQLHDTKLLTFYQMLFTIPFALFFSQHSNLHSLVYPSVLIAILFCSIFATTIAFLIQFKYRIISSVTKTVLIFSLEPVFASIFGFILYSEQITVNVIGGGLIILLSLLLPTFIELLKNSWK